MRRLAVATVLGTGLLIAGCGSASTGAGSTGAGSTSRSAASPTPSGVAAATQVRCDSARVTVTVGGQIAVMACPAGITATATDTKLVKVAAATFEAKQPGTTGIVLEARPSCSAGTLCPQDVRLVGEISVTVTAA